MQSPYRTQAKRADDQEPRSPGAAVPVCIALGVIVQLVGATTHALDSFGHIMFGFAFVLAVAGLQAGQARGP